MKIIVDAMGGDKAPEEIVKGALRARKELQVELLLVGREEAIRQVQADMGLVFHQVDFIRQPYDPRNIKAYRQIADIIDREQIDIIHCNTPVGGVIGRMAARKARKNGTKVYYTAHGFHFFDGAPLKNWLL